MIDGWRGVSERFRHIYLNNNFTQTYEIIAAAIEKDKEKWDEFRKMHSAEFEAMKTLYGRKDTSCYREFTTEKNDGN